MTRRIRCGQSIQIGKALLSIFGFAIIYLLAEQAWDPLKTEADSQITNTTAQTGADWTGLAFDNLLVITLGITVVGVIAYSSYSRQGGF